MSHGRALWKIAVVLLPAIPSLAQLNSPGQRLPGAITNVGFGTQLLNSIQGYPLPATRGGGGFGNFNGIGGIYPYLLLPNYLPPPPMMQPMVIAPSAPPVVINQTIVTGPRGEVTPVAQEPQVTSYTAPPASSDYTTPRPVETAAASRPASGGPNLYLIAFKGGAVQAAVAYWYEDGALHYVGTDHTIHDAALTSLDTALSQRLNAERGIDFHPPSP